MRRVVARADVRLGCQSLEFPIDRPRQNDVDVANVAPGILSGSHGEHLEMSLRVGLRFPAECVRRDVVPSVSIRLPEIYIGVRKRVALGVLELQDEDVDVAL